MLKIVAIHSFRGGTGKSNVTANIATILASWGQRVGIIDTDLQSPGIHILFSLDQDKLSYTLNDYLWKDCEINDAAYDVTPAQLASALNDGKIFLAPGSFRAEDITRIVNEGYDMERLSGGIHDLGDRLNLDYVLIDTHPGLNQETLLAMALADLLVFILRPDSQDFQGTAVTIDVARQLGIPDILTVVNRVLPALDISQVKALVEKTFQVPVAGILPNCDDLMLLASRGLFVLNHPKHPFTEELEAIACRIKA